MDETCAPATCVPVLKHLTASHCEAIHCSPRVGLEDRGAAELNCQTPGRQVAKEKVEAMRAERDAFAERLRHTEAATLQQDASAVNELQVSPCCLSHHPHVVSNSVYIKMAGAGLVAHALAAVPAHSPAETASSPCRPRLMKARTEPVPPTPQLKPALSDRSSD